MITHQRGGTVRLPGPSTPKKHGFGFFKGKHKNGTPLEGNETTPTAPSFTLLAEQTKEIEEEQKSASGDSSEDETGGTISGCPCNKLLIDIF